MIEITPEPLSPQPVIDKVKKDDHGAIVTFVGTVRNATQVKKVAFLKISTCSENAELKLGEVVSEINQKWQLHDIAICRRIGKLRVGEVALVIAISAPHRQEAFQSCQYAVDRLKQGRITTEN